MMPSGFAQTNLRAIGFRREIPLLDRPTVVLPQICRQTLHQKFAFDLARNFPVVGESTPHHFPLCSNACTAGKPQCFFARGSSNIHCRIRDTVAVIQSEARDLSTGHRPHNFETLDHLRDPSPSLRLGMTTRLLQGKIVWFNIRMFKILLITIAALLIPVQAAVSAANSRHVVLIVWDGMRPDFVTEKYAPTLD